MDKETTEQVIGGLPEAFYDGLAYVIPAWYLVVGISLSLESLGKAIWNVFTKPGTWVRDTLLALMFLGGLYLVGQILTTISFFIIFIPVRWIQAKCNRVLKKGYEEAETAWDEAYMRIRVNYPTISLLVTKRYARWISGRNIALASLVLIILNAVTGHWVTLIYFGLILIVFLIDVVIRKRWLDRFIQTIITIESEQHFSMSR